jgi:hypothetical protein
MVRLLVGGGHLVREYPGAALLRSGSIAIIVVLLLLTATGNIATAKALPSPTVARGYGLGKFVAPFHLALDHNLPANPSEGCANASSPVYPVFDPINGHAKARGYAMATSCPGEARSLIDSVQSLGPFFLVNSSTGASVFKMHIVFRSVVEWNFTPGSCIAAVNGSSGSCQVGAYFETVLTSYLANPKTLTGDAYGTNLNPLQSSEAFVNATCSGGACVGWSSAARSGSLNVTNSVVLTVNYTLNSTDTYWLGFSASTVAYPIISGVDATVSGAAVTIESQMGFTLESISIS